MLLFCPDKLAEFPLNASYIEGEQVYNKEDSSSINAILGAEGTSLTYNPRV